MTITGPAARPAHPTTDSSPQGIRDPREYPEELGAGAPAYLLELAKTSLPLVLFDALFFWAAVLAVTASLSLAGFSSASETLDLFLPLGLSLPLFLALIGVYPGSAISPSVEIKRLTIGVSLLFGSFAVLATTILTPQVGWIVFSALAWFAAVWAVAAGREIGRHLLTRVDAWGVRAIVVGQGEQAEGIYRQLMAHRSSGLRPVALLDSAHVSDALLPHQVAELARRQRAFWAIRVADARTARTLESSAPLGVANVLVLSPELNASQIPTGIEFFGAGMSGVRLRDRLLHPLCRFQKRVLDIGLVVIGSVVFLPIAGLLALAIKLSSRGPVLFTHQRVGRGGKHFQVWKFRTMVPDAQKVLDECLAQDAALQAEWDEYHKLRVDPRVTLVGRFLRRWSLDELPQLWNVLKGDMSLVGPRPIVDDEIVKYADSFDLYKRVWPGVTGLWQVSGRNNTTYDRRVELDSYYARNWSIWLEMHILLRTVRVVLGGQGAY